MHTVALTHAFVRAARQAGMTDLEVETLIEYVSARPTAGVEIAGTGGCRKVRFAGRGRGKSGGYRVITFYSGPQMPIFFLTVFAKGQRADLSKAERNTLHAVTKSIVAEYKKSKG